MLLTNEKKLQKGVATLAPFLSRSFRNRTNRETKSIPLPG